MTVGVSGTSVVSHPRSQHLGGTLTSQVRLPHGYRTVIGVEESVHGQLDPATTADQWRVAGLLGYSAAPTAGGSLLGWEAALRAGVYRGADAGLVPIGALAGAKLTAPLRISQQHEPWERTNLIDAPTFMLVPELGCNVLFPSDRKPEFEATAMLGLRYYFSTTLLP